MGEPVLVPVNEVLDAVAVQVVMAAPFPFPAVKLIVMALDEVGVAVSEVGASGTVAVLPLAALDND
jgi:hypothetical protein